METYIEGPSARNGNRRCMARFMRFVEYGE